MDLQAIFEEHLEVIRSLKERQAGDLLVAISTSGNSPNVLKAAETARQKGMFTAGLAGKGGGKLAAVCDLAIVVPSNRTSRIQEAHIIIGHMMCQYIEEESSGGSAG